MTHPPHPHDRDSDDEPPRVNALRRILRLLAAVHASDPDRYSRRRPSRSGMIDAGIHVGSLDSAVDRGSEDDGLPDPHVDTRPVDGGRDVIVDLQGIDPDELTVATDPVAESVVVDASGYRERRLPLPPGQAVAETRMHNGVLEIQLREDDADGGGESSG